MGFWPADGAALLIAGIAQQLPEEPRGGTWLFDPDTHLALSTKMKKRLHIFEHKHGDPPKEGDR
jgi:hypothetical protein